MKEISERMEESGGEPYDLRYLGGWQALAKDAMNALHPGAKWDDAVDALLEREHAEGRLGRGCVSVDWGSVEAELVRTAAEIGATTA